MMNLINTSKSVQVSEYNVGNDFVAIVMDYGTKQEFWLRNGITQQLYLTADGDVDRDVFATTIANAIDVFKKAWPILETDDSILGDPEGERVFPIREIDKDRRMDKE